MGHITGIITEWSGDKGSIKSDTPASKDKQFSFERSNISPMKFSAPYEPKVGDHVTGFSTDDSAGKVDKVMEFI